MAYIPENMPKRTAKHRHIALSARTKNYKQERMTPMSSRDLEHNRSNSLYSALLCLAGLLINTGSSKLALALKLPVFLDSIGTMLVAALGGVIPGIAVGFLTNVVGGISDYTTAYYGVLNVLIALAATRFQRRGMFSRPGGVIVATIIFALIGGGLGSVLTWILYGSTFGEGISFALAHRFYDGGISSVLLAQLAADILIDLLDKAVSVMIMVIVLHLVPNALRQKLYLCHWRQRPLSTDERHRVQSMTSRRMSLQRKMVVLIGTASIVVAAVVTSISYLQFHQSNVEQQSRLAYGVANVVAESIDPERVDEFIRDGEAAESYSEIRARLSSLITSSDDIQYVYAYRIREDGCQVVFDPDAPDLPGEPAGTVIPFDRAFTKYVPALLRGEAIEPVISNETYGWLLSVYMPVYNSGGECVYYAGVDISMNELANTERVFLARVLSLFFGFLIMILVVSLWLAEYSITLPINSMAMAAGAFAYDTEAARLDSLEALRCLNIHTGDEIENLYDAMVHTTQETVRYIAVAQAKSEAVKLMQDGMIMVLADLVESRDKYTGDHVRKTAAYVRITLNQMLKEGIYADRLTENYIRDVVASAPLHDVGKIQVPDALLNKPGRLTDKEFAQMRKHAADGGEIIEHAIHSIAKDNTGYLQEAENMAFYHHEKWDGSGYPEGLRGEEIPLSARVMAVADVFDALLSVRSYKKGFPIEKALDIIREGSGTHFDPNIVQAFLDAEDEVRRIATQQGKSVFS